MTPYRPKGKLTYRITVPTPTGWVKRYTGTRDKALAKQFEIMILDLGPKGQRRWDLLSAVASNRIKLAELFDAWRAKDLDGLLARLQDANLVDLIPGWKNWLRDRVAPDTVKQYTRLLKTLYVIDEAHEDAPWWRSTLTRSRVAAWLGSLEVKGVTKRRYAAALATFIHYARELGTLDQNPLQDIDLPPVPEPKIDFLERHEVDQLIAGSAAPYADAFALIYGTGAEVSAVVPLRRRDVDLGTFIIRLPGTKSRTRDRQAIVAEWARPAVVRLCANKLPDAPLFTSIDRWKLTKTHKAVLEAKKVRHVKLHAARNHWAVRALRGGWSEEAVARQLGHANAAMVHRVYGRYRQSSDDLARLERQAEAEAVRRVSEA